MFVLLGRLRSGMDFDAIIPNVFSYLHKGGKVFFYGDGAITESEQASYLAQSILFSLRLGIDVFSGMSFSLRKILLLIVKLILDLFPADWNLNRLI
jgi:hypothetical protein